MSTPSTCNDTPELCKGMDWTVIPHPRRGNGKQRKVVHRSYFDFLLHAKSSFLVSWRSLSTQNLATLTRNISSRIDGKMAFRFIVWLYYVYFLIPLDYERRIQSQVNALSPPTRWFNSRQPHCSTVLSSTIWFYHHWVWFFKYQYSTIFASCNKTHTD